MKKKAFVLLGILLFCSTFSLNNGYCLIIKEKGRTFLIDMTGARWDISQAVSIGFDPDKFQFGLGKNAIKPLDDSNLEKSTQEVPPDLRILGVNKNNISKAYSIPKLSRHEIANSSIDSVPIAAAYGPLVDLAAVYSRKIYNKTLTLVASGWTYNHTFVLFDRETGTIWYPYKEGLMGIQGTYFKKWLRKIPANDTTWQNWNNKYPDTKLLRGSLNGYFGHKDDFI